MQFKKLAILPLLLCIPSGGCHSFMDGPFSRSSESPLDRAETIETHQLPIVAIRFSPDQRHIATFEYNVLETGVRASPLASIGFLRLWGWSQDQFHILRGLSVASLGFEAQPQSLQFSPDGTKLICAISSRLKTLNIEQQEWKAELQTGGYFALLSNDGRLVAANRNDAAVLMRVTDGTVLQTLAPGHSAIAFSPGSKFLLTGYENGARLMDVESGEIIADLPTQFQLCSPYQADQAFSSDGLTIVGQDQENRIILYQSQTGQQNAVIGRNSGPIWCAAFSPDGQWLASGGEGENGAEIRIWNVNESQLVQSINDNKVWGFTAVAFSPDGQTLAAGNSDGEMKLWKFSELIAEKDSK